MHARVMSGRVDPERLGQLVHVLRESVLPSANEQAGYRGALALIDQSTGRSMLITLWESAGDLEMTECGGTLCNQLARVAALIDGPTVRETLEVVAEHLTDPSMARPPLTAETLPTETDVVHDL